MPLPNQQMDQDKLSLSTSDVIGSIDDSFKSVAAEKIMENNNAVDVKGCEDDTKTGIFVTLWYVINTRRYSVHFCLKKK